MIWSHMGIRKGWWGGGSMTDGRPCSSPCTWLGVTMLKVAMLHAGSAGVFVLLHPHHCLPFMYPDGVHFDLHCVLAPASSFPTSYSLFARRRFPSLPLSHTRTVFNHIIMSRQRIELISGLSLLCTDDLFAVLLLSPLNVKRTPPVFLRWIFNDAINSCPTHTHTEQTFQVISN